MISKSEREQIIALIKREVVPAIGCTEPIAVSRKRFQYSLVQIYLRMLWEWEFPARV